MNVREIVTTSLQSATGFDTVQLTFADRPEHGDYTTNIAMQSGKNPRDFAIELVEKLKKDSVLMSVISTIEIAGPGFINFFISDELVKSEVNRILTEKKNYGRSDTYGGKKVIVEYSSPNIAKPFTIGHFRSTIIGDAVANLLETQGYTVYRDNHLGDWGTQFGKQIAALKYIDLETGETDFGGTGFLDKNIEKIENSDRPVKLLVDLYVKFHTAAETKPEYEDVARSEFAELEKGNKESKDLWQKCIDWSWKEFDVIYKHLGVTFTENDGKGYGESFFEDKMETVVSELTEKELLKEGKEGAKLVFFEDEKYPPLMILKKDGATLYATRDLATDKWRLHNERYGNDVTIINEVGGEQALYFTQIFEIEKTLGWVKDGQRVHIKHGLFRFKDKKMSTRKGNVIWLEDVLNEAHQKALNLSVNNTEATEKISIGALKWNELKRDPISDIVFDWDEILNMKGNSGPYLQYTVVRINSLVTKYGKELSSLERLVEEVNPVVRMLLKFPEMLKNSAQKYQSSALADYLYSLASEFNTFYDSQRILGNEYESDYVSVASAVGIVLTNGLQILGIQVPDKM